MGAFNPQKTIWQPQRHSRLFESREWNMGGKIWNSRRGGLLKIMTLNHFWILMENKYWNPFVRKRKSNHDAKIEKNGTNGKNDEQTSNQHELLNGSITRTFLFCNIILN